MDECIVTKETHLVLRSSNEKRTRKIGLELGKILSPGSILALEGSLGSGKTVFVQGIAQGLGVRHPEEVRSPTFAIIQEHKGKISLCHADLYRLQGKEILDLGLEEYWQARSQKWVIAIEWADKAEIFLPLEFKSQCILHIRFELLSLNERRIWFKFDPEWEMILTKWKRTLTKKF